MKNCVYTHAHYENRVQDKKQQSKGKRKQGTRTQTTKEAASPGVRIWGKNGVQLERKLNSKTYLELIWNSDGTYL